VGRLASAGVACAFAVTALASAAPAAAGRLEAVFTAASYAPGAQARLAVTGAAGPIQFQLFRAGPERGATYGDTTMRGMPVTDAKRATGGVIVVRVHHWAAGVYFASVRSGGQTVYAPFVLRAGPTFSPRVAVVVPTFTWQAYNLRDDNGDGTVDSWYADDTVASVAERRPFARRGVPPHFRQYDLGFLRWYARSGRQAAFLADEDLDAVVSPAGLARRFDLIVFPGHEEYVTEHIYDLVTGYRDRGGNLLFLSANNFFARVDRHDGRLTRVGRWRDLGRPEAALVGIQYVDWYQERYPNAPYVVTGVARAPWLFRGTQLRNGSRFGTFGIEIDARAAASPPGVEVLATAQDIFGAGNSAELAFYRTASGAKVLGAGVLNFGGSAMVTPVGRLIANAWDELSQP
jgi:hypothetical protein